MQNIRLTEKLRDGDSVAYQVGRTITITEDDVAPKSEVASGLQYAAQGTNLEGEQKLFSLRGQGLLAAIDRALTRQRVDCAYGQANLSENPSQTLHTYLAEILGIQDAIQDIGSDSGPWGTMILEVGPGGQLREPRYDLENGLEFIPNVGAQYQVFVTNGADIADMLTR